MPQSDDKVFISGDFYEVNGVSRGYIARLNADGTLGTGFQNGLSGANLFVNSVVVQSDGKVLIAGQFTSVNGLGRNVDGTLDDTFQIGLSTADISSSYVRSISVQGAGRVLIGGQFTTVNGASRNDVARLNGDGTLDPAFRTDSQGPTTPFTPSLCRATAKWSSAVDLAQ